MYQNKKKVRPLLMLGSANLGNKEYGLNKNTIKKQKILKIINFAIDKNIKFFDSARSYNSEIYLSNKNIKVFTKLIPIKKTLKNKLDNKKIENLINKSIKVSQKNLKKKSLHCVMLHKVEDLRVKKGVVLKILKSLKQKGIIENLGISIDKFKHIDEIINNKDLKYIQIPINIYDQRWKQFFLKKPKYSLKNKILIARSIYLQGLINKENWPDKIKKFKKIVMNTNNLLEEKFLTNIDEIMFNYVKSLNKFKYLIFGASKIATINKNINFLKKKNLTKKQINFIEKSTKNISENFYDIINWKN